MKVWSICASISVTITDIWTKFGTEHKYRTTNTPEWPNSHNVKIQDGGGRHLEFQENVNNFGLDKEWPNSHKLTIQDSGGRHIEFRKNFNNFGPDKDILDQIIWEDASRPCGDDHMTKSLNRKLIRMTSSTKGLKHITDI